MCNVANGHFKTSIHPFIHLLYPLPPGSGVWGLKAGLDLGLVHCRTTERLTETHTYGQRVVVNSPCRQLPNRRRKLENLERTNEVTRTTYKHTQKGPRGWIQTHNLLAARWQPLPLRHCHTLTFSVKWCEAWLALVCFTPWWVFWNKETQLNRNQ